MALYREFRPKSFEDIIGQDHIVTTLKNQINSDRIAHAYLFTGTRGTGKTSTAKIFSKAVNCLTPIDGSPCNECTACIEINKGTLLDVVEMDAASNRKLENALDIIETVKYPPQSARYKVYIIDEVHMLTTQAFNALLKTIEEPPSYVIFILATTDPQKVPATILSRCQRFDFKRIKGDDAFLRLRHIINMKGVFAEDEALKLIAKVSEGAMRDCLSILDQAISMGDGRVDRKLVSEMLGITGREAIYNLIDYMSDGNIDSALREIDSVMMSGKDIMQFIKDIIKHLRNLLVVRVSKNPEDTIDIGLDTVNDLLEQSRKLRYEDIVRAINIFIEAEQEIKLTSQWRIVLEMAIIRFSKREYDISTETLLKRISRLEDIIESGSIVRSTPQKEKEVPQRRSELAASEAVKDIEVTSPNLDDSNSTPSVIEEEEDTASQGVGSMSEQQAKGALVEVLNILRANKKMTVYAHLVNGKVQKVEGNTIYISFRDEFSFSKTILEKPDYTKGLQKYFEKYISSPVRLKFIIEKGEDDSFNESINRAKSLLGEEFVEVIE
ncbi:DNA polymerase III subunit gamma/tau [Clostridium cylindrosporum]|nr:DNA polymerase III subunit gamma/tau [Clostridium cylindrosporum]